MTVNIYFSDESGGTSISDTFNFGEGSPGSATTPKDIFIRHDGVNAKITNCSFYVTRCMSESYTGADANADLTELLGFGDSGYGLQINQVIPVGGWSPGDEFEESDCDSFRNGHGDINNKIVLSEDAISIGAKDGASIAIGGEAHVQIRYNIPSSVYHGSGQRGLTMVFAYDATS